MIVRPHPLVVAIDARMAGHSGIGTHICNLVPRLAEWRPNWRFRLLGVPDRLRDRFQAPNLAFAAFDAPIYSIAEQFALLRAATGADLFWSPHYNFPMLARIPTLVTIHDVNHLAIANDHGAKGRAYARTLFQTLRRRATGICFVSEFAQAEFERLVGPLRQPHWLTPNGVDNAWFERQILPEPARRHVIAISNGKAHKNLAGLLQAYAAVAATHDIDLLLAGKMSERAERQVDEFARSARLEGRIRRLGELDQAELIRHVASASALLFPSFYEGFGLPPLEAMAARCPTIVSQFSPMTEICGAACEYVDPDQPEDIARGLLRVLNDRDHADQLRRLGRARARSFGWRQATRQWIAAADTIIALQADAPHLRSTA